MRHLILTTLVLGLLACGGQDSSSQMSDAADAAGGSIGDVAAGAGIDPSAQSCLELVAKADWSGAIPLCTEAVNIAPDNMELRDALATAKSGLRGQ